MENFLYENMVDIHCHLLPNVDDGPKSWEESLEMARLAVEDGIRVAVTTPHWIQGTKWDPYPEEIRDKVRELNERLKEEKIPLTVLPGMEVAIAENLPELVSSGRILTLGDGKYLLVEIPVISLPLGVEEIIFGLKTIGISPILAHPERNKEIQKNPKKVLELVRTGASVQVTAGSFCGYFGEKAQRCVLELAKLGAVNAIASDAHNVDNRPPIVTGGLRVLEQFMKVAEIQSLLINTHRFIEKESELLRL
ncbi:MAG TPA: CpsB/CapC family capsule biosynthesis tyrosine phosphatase [Thermodesulfobacteriota bacterium]|jgi:protein-tyrosine phosphatase